MFEELNDNISYVIRGILKVVITAENVFADISTHCDKSNSHYDLDWSCCNYNTSDCICRYKYVQTNKSFSHLKCLPKEGAEKLLALVVLMCEEGPALAWLPRRGSQSIPFIIQA